AARYEIVPHEAAIVAGLFRRYADEGVAIAELARWLGSTGITTRTGKTRWDLYRSKSRHVLPDLRFAELGYAAR
ncbi:MAG TPA: recombinase family protein, partial [Streptosporangiaceae bacterium]